MGIRPSVLILSFSPITRDPRVLRQIRLLSTIADVTTCGFGPAPDGVVRHIRVPDELSPWRPGRAGRLVSASLLMLRWHHRLYFSSPRIAFVLQAVPPGSMDVVFANDALAAPLALALEPREGVHSDLHEFAPRQGEDRFLWRLLVGPFMWWACRVVPKVTSVTTVAQGIASEYERELGFAAGVVPNAAQYRSELVPTTVGIPMRLVHIGIAGRARRLETMIDAVALVELRRPGTVTLDLVLAPGDASYIEELSARARAVGGMVRVLPPVPFEEIVPVLTAYDAGIFVCPPTTFNLLHALPNKLFEFVQARLAVVVGPSPEMARVVTEHGIGLVAEGFTAEDTARAISALDPDAVNVFKAASHYAASALSGEQLSAPWLEAVERMLE